MLLLDLRKGDKSVITGLLFSRATEKAEVSKTLHKLMAMGLLPGVGIQVLQTFPCYVVGIGYSQVAIDNALARSVIVEDIPARI